MLKIIAAATAVLLAAGAVAVAQPSRVLTSVPPGAVTVTDWSKQPVYDANDKRIGTIGDVLLDKDGKVAALIVGVGGFLGVGSKDVAVPFNAVKVTTKNDKPYRVMETTKEELANAPGYKFDRTARTWVQAEKAQPPAKKKR
jgi:sporulation protein YlmC with PRC-barrel domain